MARQVTRAEFDDIFARTGWQVRAVHECAACSRVPDDRPYLYYDEYGTKRWIWAQFVNWEYVFPALYCPQCGEKLG